MITDTEHNARARGSEAGLTLLEVIIATVAMMVLSLLVARLIISGNRAHDFATRLGRTTEVSQRIMNDLKRELRAAVRLFGNDTVGLGYKSRLQAWTNAQRIASSKLPSISTTGFSKDVAGSEKTGNEMLFARHAWTDSFTCTSGSTYRVDIYRMVAIYLRIEGSGPRPRDRGGLNLCKWTSEPLIDGVQIDRITDATDRTEVLLHLFNQTPDDEGVEHARAEVVWLVGNDPATAGTLRQILADGSLSNSPQLPRASSWEIEGDPTMSTPGMLFSNHHSIASNYVKLQRTVGRFGIRNDSSGSGIGFPHGFEVQIIGPAAARQVMLHLTTVGTNRDGLQAHFDAQVIVNVREG